MATGGQEDISEIDISVISGSEALFDHVCQPCLDDEKTREAVGFCVDCADWLCDDCFRIHTRPKPWKNHILRDMEDMKNSTSHPKPADKCTQRCAQHTGKKIKYFCADHDFLGCSLCIFQGHKICKVDHIPDVCESPNIKTEFQKVTTNLEGIAKVSKETVSKVNKNKKLIQKSKTEAVTTCRGYIQKLKDSLDETGTALEEMCEKKAEDETEKMTNVSENCETVKKESLCIKTRLEDLESSGQHCNTFVALKQSKASVVLLESKLKDSKRSSTVTTYTFKPNLAIEATITGSDGIGSLEEHRPGKEMCTDYSNVQAHHITDIFVGKPGNKTCGITGSVLLSPNKLVPCDYDNKQVKVIDTRTNKMISDYTVDGTPWGVCKESDKSVVVTVWDKPKLLFLSVNASGKITLTKTKSTNGQCSGVAVLHDNLVVTFMSDSRRMEITDTNGTVLQTITNPQIVNSPQYVVASPDRKFLYVSNCTNNTMACMNLNGKLIATYQDSQLNVPEQISVDGNGMVFVGGRASRNVHLVTPDCKKVKVILDETDGLKSVYAISYCEQTDRLYIGMDECDVIKVFQLSRSS